MSSIVSCPRKEITCPLLLWPLWNLKQQTVIQTLVQCLNKQDNQGWLFEELICIAQDQTSRIFIKQTLDVSGMEPLNQLLYLLI